MSEDNGSSPENSSSSNDITPQTNNIQNDNQQDWEVNNPSQTYNWTENKFVYQRKHHQVDTTNLENKSGLQ